MTKNTPRIFISLLLMSCVSGFSPFPPLPATVIILMMRCPPPKAAPQTHRKQNRSARSRPTAAT